MSDPVGFDWFDPNKTMELMAERQKIYDHQSGGAVRHGEPCPAELPAISVLTQQWYDALPRRIRPCMLRAKFPRVLDSLQQNWPDPVQLQAEFKHLLIDDRGSRQGFPFAALQELHRVRDYYFEELNPAGAELIAARTPLNDQSR